MAQRNTSEELSEEQLHYYFQRIDTDGSGEIDAKELKAGLRNGDWSTFDLGTVRFLMSIFDTDNSGTISFEEFSRLWMYLCDWQKVFKDFDADNSGTIDALELYNAFKRFRFDVSPENSQLVLRKYSHQSDSSASGGNPLTVSFDRFVRACVAVKHLHKLFVKFDKDSDGSTRIKFNDFLESVFSLPESWDTLDEDFALRTTRIIQKLERKYEEANRRLAYLEGHSINNLKGREASAMADYLQSRLDQQPDPESAALLMRMLQDLCSTTDELPNSYWLTEYVTVHTSTVIKTGGEAVIFHGEHGGRHVAVRCITAPDGVRWDSPKGKDIIKLIQREILVHRQLKHPNAIPLIGVFQEAREDSVIPLIILPYYKYGSARSWFVKNMSPVNYMNVLIDVVEGLSYLHGRSPPFIHGDLHGGNILIDDNWKAILCDFGLSRAKHEVTRVLTRMQTTENYRFVAPELFKVLRDLDSSPSPTPNEGRPKQEPLRTTQVTDIYALGMTFYELGTLRYPLYDSKHPEDAAERALKGERPPQPGRLGGFTESGDIDKLWAMITGMWREDPQSRSSLDKVRRTLLEIRVDGK